jgi:PAS domain S-box-containing protein
MISLLHVDSDATLQGALREFLHSCGGISVVSLPSAYEALDVLKTMQFDVIVSEYNLPTTDGQTFLEILRRGRKNSTPFIFFAKKADRHGVINALNTGATFYVLKGKEPENEFAVLKHFIYQAIQQKRLEDALKEREKQYRSVVEDQSEFIIRFLSDGTLVFANEAYCAYFKKSRDELLGKNVRDLIPSSDQEKFFCQLQSLTRENPVSTTDSRTTSADGSILWQQWCNRAIFNEQHQLSEYQSVGRDITAQKNAESALVQVNKNLGVMNTITRHDILNQLTAVFNFLEIARQSNQDRNVGEYLARAELAAETIHGHILFTRDYQEIGSTAPQWQNLDAVVKKALSGLDLTGIRIEITLAGLWIFADPLVEKVFYNLVENTLRHAGEVSVIRISCREDEAGLLIVYEDDGIGIPGEVKEKIFRREYYRNTGLGLYLIREILAITKIQIRECGSPGQGVRFEMTVPQGTYGFRTDGGPLEPVPVTGNKK